MSDRYRTFSEFYPYYISEHRDPTNRRLHFLGSCLVLAVMIYALLEQQWLLLLAMPVLGYGFAWIGHFFFERNRPATFTYPLYSLMGDWVMFYEIISLRRPL